MRKFTLIILTVFLSMNAYSQKRKIPFFGKIKLSELCGSNDCRGSWGEKAYVHKNDRLYYNGNYNSILGRVFTTSIFDTRISGLNNITKDDVDYFAEQNGSGSLLKNVKTEFDAKLNADLSELLRKEVDLPEDLKAKLLAELDNTITRRTNNTIDFGFKIIQLKNVGDIGAQITDIRSRLNENQKLITSISVVTISGEWTSYTLKEVLNTFEANVDLEEVLSAQAKLTYDKSRERVLGGRVKEFGFIIGDTYIMNN